MRPTPEPPSPTGDAGASPTAQQPPKVPALTLGWIFLCIGTTAFGGLGTTLALIEREPVTKRWVLTAADVTEALTYTKLASRVDRPAGNR